MMGFIWSQNVSQDSNSGISYEIQTLWQGFVLTKTSATNETFGQLLNGLESWVFLLQDWLLY